jgi:O-antigen ligase
MNPTNARQAAGLGWALLAVLLALPWLVETHVAPWTMFYPDWCTAAALLALTGWALTRSAAGWCVTILPLGVAALTLVPLLQAAGGLIAFPTEGVLAALYLAGFMLAVLTGLRSEALAPSRAAEALFAGLAIASIASVGLQLYQWLELGQLGVMVLQLPTKGRPFANVGQSNLLATLLVWGLIALWWAYERARIGPTGAVLGAAFLLLGVAITQSRTGWLEVALLAAVAVARPRALTRALPRAAVLTLGLWFVALVLVWPQLGSQLGLDPAIALTDQAAVGKRPAIWRLGIAAITARPWLGWGWNQGGEAHVALAAGYPSLPVLISYMHNLALDLMLWNGIPIGALALLGLGGWFVRRWRGEGSAQQRLLLLALTVLLVHAMLELPHGHAVFLLPAGLMMGLVEAHSGARSVLAVPRWAVGALALALATALGVLASEHRAVEQDLVALRMRAAKIANLPTLGPVPQLILMAPFSELLASLRIAPVAGLDEASLDLLHRVAYHYPSTGNLLRLAQADGLNSRPAQAREALTLLCQLRPAADCEGAAQHWREMGRTDYPALAAIEPPDPPSSVPVGVGDAATIPRHTSEPR